ncbi:RRQRL motif-containing zinc-binding protein [Nocardia sp. CC227C]|uniref:RRQRL motif-containing zinc-binding protein n=1 Tax=Nocardia sp. CC227C TaxID=3044562 RepID=UPI00278C732B|nr:RRQRL motif-containing zinc-binding protein [Nocardia sp. CC227C]
MSWFIGEVPRDYRDFTPDPTGEKYGIPTYFWKTAPVHLLTRRQLRSVGLRPGGQDIAAQVVILRRHREPLVAHLFDVNQAALKREATPAQLEALRKATREHQLRAAERHGVDRAQFDQPDRSEAARPVNAFAAATERDAADRESGWER